MIGKKIDKNRIKTWFVTGASSGIGHELCEQLLKRGYNVIAVARRKPVFTNVLNGWGGYYLCLLM